MLEALWDAHEPADAAQEGLVLRLARAMWLMNRADRMQEGYTVRQAQEASVGRQDRVHVQMMRLKMMAERLRRLARSVARPHYVTPLADLEAMKRLHGEEALKGMGEIALALCIQLQAPNTDENGVDDYTKAKRVVAQVQEIFGIGRYAPKWSNCLGAGAGGQASGAGVTPASGGPPASRQDAGAAVEAAAASSTGEDANEAEQDSEESEDRMMRKYPQITAEEWAARERPRQLLENILRRQAEICEAQRKVLLKESLAGPSPYERAAEIAPTHPNIRLMRGLQDANFREFRRLTNLLLKLKQQGAAPDRLPANLESY